MFTLRVTVFQLQYCSRISGHQWQVCKGAVEGTKATTEYKIIVINIQSSTSPVCWGELNFGGLENVTHREQMADTFYTCWESWKSDMKIKELLCALGQGSNY